MPAVSLSSGFAAQKPGQGLPAVDSAALRGVGPVREQAYALGEGRGAKGRGRRRGRHGHYVQLGDNDGDERDPRGTVPMGMDPNEVTPDVAHALLAMPRSEGVHPDTGQTILPGIGPLRLVAQARHDLRAAAGTTGACLRSASTGPARW